MLSEIFIRAIKFIAVGFTGMLIDLGFTFFMKEKLSVNKFIANAIGFSCAVINNYLLNRVWTFNSQDSHVIRQFSFFLAVSISGLLLNTAILYFLNEKKRWNFYFSKLLVVIIIFFWNFTANSLFTFHHVG